MHQLTGQPDLYVKLKKKTNHKNSIYINFYSF